MQNRSNGTKARWHAVMRCGGLYFWLAIAAILLSRQPGSIANVWYANALGVACLVTESSRRWPGLLRAVALANLFANLLTGSDLPQAALFAIPNTLEVLLGAWLIRRTQSDRKFDDSMDSLLRLLTIGSFVPPLAGATLGASILAWRGIASFDLLWITWYAGSTLGSLTVLPLALVWLRPRKGPFLPRQEWVKTLSHCLALLAVTIFVMAYLPYPFVYMVVALLLSAARLRFEGFALLLALVSATMGAMTSLGYFLIPPFISNWQMLFVYLPSVLTLIPPLLLAATINQVKRRDEALADTRSRFRNAMEFAATGFGLCDRNGLLSDFNAYLCDLMGASREQLAQTTLHEFIHPEDRKRFSSHLRSLGIGEVGSFEIELRMAERNQYIPWGLLRMSRLGRGGQGTEFIVQIDDITERRERERVVAELSERLGFATAAAGMGVWDWDLTTDELIWDERMYALYWGVPEGGIDTHTLWQMRMHPDDAEEVQAFIKTTLAGKQHPGAPDDDVMEAFANTAFQGKGDFNLTFRIVGPLGEVRTIQASGFVKHDSEGRPLRMIGLNWDISAQTEARLAIARANDELQTIINHMPAVVGYWDTEERNRFGNSAYQRWFGWSTTDLKGHTVQEIIGDVRYAMSKPHIDAALRGEASTFEREVAGRDGQVRHELVTYQPDLVDGVVKGFYTFVTDISPLKQAQAAHIAAESQLRSVIDSAGEFSIITTDLNGTIRLFSVGAERMLGYTAEEMVGKQTPAIVHVPAEVNARCNELSVELGYPVKGFEAFVARCRLGSAESREWTYVRKDGSTFTVNLVVSAIRNPDGEITGFLGMGTDITRQKEAQAMLSAAKEQAEQASRAKSDFVANMSHEIRTPMNAVLGMAHLLENTRLDNDQRKYLGMIRASGQSLLTIINDILDFSKIEAGRMELAPAEFQMDDLMNTVASIMSVNAGAKDLELAIVIQPDVPPRLHGDAMRLQQVLVNLTGNAIKFTREGEVSLHVELAAPLAGDSAQLRFSVRDTGIGMTSEQLERLFSAFSQADTSITRRFGGTGLGLVISKSLVQLMGGQIGVSSQPGEGTEFWFTLPLQRVADTRPARSQNPLNILVVDDNDTCRSALSSMVQSWGWHCDTAVSGEQSVHRVRQRHAEGKAYDAILIDYRMPGMDGVTTARALLSIRRTPVLLMVNAYGRDLLAQTPGVELTDGVLLKPITGSSLLDAIMQARQQQTQTTEAAAEPSPPTQPANRLDGARLLLVEDNTVNQAVACGILRQAGAHVDVAGDGQQALDRLRETPDGWDIVLMDVQMPVMDGFTATRLIRSELKLNHLPIIAMTAGVLPAEREQCRVAGMDDFIPKPLDVPEVFKALGRHWTPKLAPAASSAPPSETKAASAPVSPPAAAPTPAATAPTSTANAAQGPAFVPSSLLGMALSNPSSRGAILGTIEGIISRGTEPINDARKALSEDRRTEAAKVFHSMRGSLGSLGAVRLPAMSMEVETAIRENRPVDQLLESIEAELANVVKEARAWLEEKKNETPS
ncbi:PAS domain S-box protein [Parachitinimonas caeni]|uniref:histidine kinase n=1 Tax=Parachitinimonas caeni TaxID=3031301 RepID=A0ABT7E2Q0_9NEIS|nr:PAS domain S-box protein [Parachitinimonas caeni]MDK2126589.1 PAS domain S-box protein [Parachitinimonas caeni]